MFRFVCPALVVACALLGCGGERAATAPAEDVTRSATITGEQSRSDIVETAATAGKFNTLVKALKAADLESTLKGPGPYTVFAPTDEAFAKLPPGTLDELLKPENKEKLRAILTYHVIAEKVPAQQAMSMSSAKTVNGQMLSLAPGANGGLSLDGKANVVDKDIMASNGVIHVIDTVLMPK